MITLLKNRNYLLLWLAQIISGLGDVLYNVGVMVIIFQQTGSALQTAGVMVATTLPSFLLGPFAGAFVDGHSRRRVLMTMDVLRAALVGTLFFMSPDAINVWLVYAVVAGIAAATTYHQPAHLALVPSLVPRNQLAQANSIMIGTKQATMAAGYILGGILVLLIPFRFIVGIDLASFLVSALLVQFIRPHSKAESAQNEKRPPVWQSISDGWGYLRQHPIARPLVIMEVIEHLPHGVWTSAMTLVFIERAVNGSPTNWGYFNAFYFVGGFVGAVIASSATKVLNRYPGWTIIINAFLAAALTVVFSQSPTVLIAIIMAFVYGPPMSIRDVAQDTLLQVSVDDGMMGRVYAMRNMFRNVVFMAGGLLFAWLADVIDVRQIYIIAALLYFGTAFYALSSRALRQSMIEEKDSTEQDSTEKEN